jgi:hypothetical protein
MREARFVVTATADDSEPALALTRIEGVDVAQERHLTGEVVLLCSAGLSAMTVLAREIGRYARDRQLTIRAQELKIGKGTLSFKGFDSDEVVEILNKIQPPGS